MVIHARKFTEDKFAEGLSGFNGAIVRTSLSAETGQEPARDLAGK